MADREARLKPSHDRPMFQFLLTLTARLALVTALTAYVCGLLRTFVFHASPTAVLSNSRSGITLVFNASVLDRRGVNAADSRLKISQPHSDDSGLFLSTPEQQFVPSFHVPGLHIVAGGWGVSEQGTVAFVMAARTSTAIVISHPFILTSTLLLNMLLFGFFHWRSTSAKTVRKSTADALQSP